MRTEEQFEQSPRAIAMVEVTEREKERERERENERDPIWGCDAIIH